jgi:ribosomal protein S18 acetylase RimI-like enzyme
MNIRPAQFPEDFEDILKLNTLISPDEGKEYLLHEISKFKGAFFVAIENGKIIGFTSLGYPYWNQIGLMFHLSVKESYRSQGVGSLLIKTVIDEAKKLKIRFVTVRTATWNTRAIKFYERNGFRQKATFESYFGDGNTMIWLDCDLR